MSEPSSSPRRLGSQYTLESVLGRGGFGTVWTGRDRDGNALAFKVLHESFAHDPRTIERFVQERGILLGLDDPHLVRVRDMVIENDTYALVMDLVTGGDLRQLIRAEGKLSPYQACTIAAGIASALTAIHARGIVHRDVKPENVLIERADDRLSPRLSDFGIARIAGTAQESTVLSGTPKYVAPELFDEAPPTPSSDLYALGVVLHEMLSGAPPFGGDSFATVMRMHLESPPPPIDGIEPSLWNLIEQLLRKDPADRPESAAGVAGALRRLRPGRSDRTTSAAGATTADATAAREITIRRPLIKDSEAPADLSGVSDHGDSPPMPAQIRVSSRWSRRVVVTLLAASIAIVSAVAAVAVGQFAGDRGSSTAGNAGRSTGASEGSSSVEAGDGTLPADDQPTASCWNVPDDALKRVFAEHFDYQLEFVESFGGGECGYFGTRTVDADNNVAAVTKYSYEDEVFDLPAFEDAVRYDQLDSLSEIVVVDPDVLGDGFAEIGGVVQIWGAERLWEIQIYGRAKSVDSMEAALVEIDELFRRYNHE